MDSSSISLVAIHSETAAKLNFACHQSAFAFLRNLRIENTDLEEPLEDVFVTLTSDPSFLKPKSWRLDRIAAAGSISIGDRDVDLDGEFLLNLSDTIRGTINFRVEVDGQLFDDQNRDVELLAYNEWGGAGYMACVECAVSTLICQKEPI